MLPQSPLALGLVLLLTGIGGGGGGAGGVAAADGGGGHDKKLVGLYSRCVAVVLRYSVIVARSKKVQLHY